MKASRPFQFLIRNVSRCSLQGLASFSSYSSANPRSLNFSTDEDDVDVEVEEGGSSVYRHALRQQRPTTIRWQPQLENSVSFIGWVDRPLEVYKTKNDHFGAYTFINVKNPDNSNRTFRMQVEMWDDMAKMGIQHLKQNDTIYVSGHLGELGLESRKDLLYLWQLFFCKPYEWWDKRKNKHSSSPDFKHKYTGENLWLRPDDPPWVKRQLQLLDLEMAKQRHALGLGLLCDNANASRLSS
ncbi:hypothetical protein GH714_005515 [Hevea brasiliensis]|uniref:Protein OSB1, mitochondrial n=1 Tax=Hevea brasiliensis TaxID=3981 RepID=A0A6A6M833_HEVBR|nr:hypothetical protein GH714_005515 [Hevea brasiliensis]